MEPHPSEVKQPHQMSPEEFAEHPLAVYHSTALAGNLHERRHAATPMHLGTRRAAEHRRANVGYPGELFTFHDVPSFSGPAETLDPKVTLRDATAHQLHSRARRLVGPERAEQDLALPSADHAYLSGHYTNLVEHPGSISAVRTFPANEIMSHHEAVRRALDAGKESEVHPVTLKMYREGKLKEPEEITYAQNNVVKKAAYRDLHLSEPGSVSIDELHHHVEPEPGTQQAWALGGDLNVGLTRRSHGWGDTSRGARAYLNTEHDQSDPRLSSSGTRAERDIDAEHEGYNNVVEDLNYSRALHRSGITDTRGPDLDRIRHYYRAGGWLQ